MITNKIKFNRMLSIDQRNAMWDTGLHIMGTNITNKRIIAIKLRRFRYWTRVTCTVEGIRDDYDHCGKIRYKETFDVFGEGIYHPEISKLWNMAEKELEEVTNG